MAIPPEGEIFDLKGAAAMLGFFTVVYIGRPESPNRKVLARWESGLLGIGWIEDLVKAGKAKKLRGNGYPNRYEACFSVVIHAIKENRIKPSGGPWVVGDDYVQAPGHIGNLELAQSEIDLMVEEVVVTIDAWDQS